MEKIYLNKVDLKKNLLTIDYWLLADDNKGISALLTIVVIGIASLIMAYSASFLGLGDLEIGFDAQKGEEVLSLAEGCAEETILQLKGNGGYSGGTLNLEEGSCIINVLPSGSDRTLDVTAVIDEYERTLQINLTLSGSSVTVNSWREIEN